jgi:anti-sigma B factor antagonist
VDLLDIHLSGRTSPPVLHVKGEIDLATADQLRAALHDAMAADPSVILDMEGVTFIDASGLRVVLNAANSLNGGRRLTLTNARLAARLLALVGLSDLPSIELQNDGAPRG